MKIAIPVLNFARAGGYRVLSNLANEWVQLGNDVEMISYGKNTPYYPVSESVKITYLNSNNTYEGLKKEYEYIVKNFDKYDAIIANHNRTSFLVFLCGLKKGNFNKCYYYIQAYEPEFYHSNKFRKFIAWSSYFLPLKKIVNSEIYLFYKNIKANKVVYPGIDLSVYYNKDFNYFNNKLKIGCIGRTEEWKGTKDVCQAIKILKEINYPIDFYIAFNDIIDIEHFFVEPDGDKNLAQFYREMDVIVAPGHIQLGAVHYPVIEAMACGTTVITTGYLPADETNSYIIPIKSPEKIAEAIIRIDTEREKAIVKRMKAYEEIKQFDWKEVSRKFLNYMEE